ncbi:MGMT family protein [Paenibacillus sp. IB182496]|uniref:MGMT family protein n=1 Tax=Paenibacillus sabuli TaxID=2772509 RepID=A0A927GU61_9BACL|nr:MGMT family protein [Paenibacillus sabuli]
MSPFTEEVLSIVSAIPAGRVMTYGQIAGLAGSPRGARQVVRILHAMSRSRGLPWQRVVNAAGQIALKDGPGFELQRMLLEAEGVTVGAGGRIDLEQYRHHPAGPTADGN